MTCQIPKGFSTKSSDCNYVAFEDMERDDYVPYGLNIGGGDYLEGRLCMECGQFQRGVSCQRFQDYWVEPEPLTCTFTIWFGNTTVVK